MAVYRVNEPFATSINGVPRVYRAGDLVHEDDAVLKGREQFFMPVEEHAARTAQNFETASAEPGRRRTRTAPRGRRSKSAKAGIGPAVNADTGEVTQLGDPLPEIPQADGTPLPPADED